MFCSNRAVPRLPPCAWETEDTALASRASRSRAQASHPAGDQRERGGALHVLTFCPTYHDGQGIACPRASAISLSSLGQHTLYSSDGEREGLFSQSFSKVVWSPLYFLFMQIMLFCYPSLTQFISNLHAALHLLVFGFFILILEKLLLECIKHSKGKRISNAANCI